MNNVFIINSYPNTEEKLNVLHEYILQVKKSKYDIILISHLSLPKNIIDLVDYYIYDKENFLLPKERSPVVWFADHEEYINLYSNRHGYAIIKNLYISLNFAKYLGYDNFIFSEYDNCFGDKDVLKFKNIFDIIENTDKKIFMFKLDNQLYNKYNKVYFTNFFAANINFFLENITLVKNYNEWCSIMPYANTSDMIETLFVGMMQFILNQVHEESLNVSEYFNNSKIDLFSIYDYSYPIIYNLEDKNQPLFFILCKGGYYELNINNQLVISQHYNKGSLLKYKFNIHENDTIVELKYNDQLVISKKINTYSIENYKDFAVRGKIK